MTDKYTAWPAAVDMASMWRDGCTVGQKLVHSLLVCPLGLRVEAKPFSTAGSRVTCSAWLMSLQGRLPAQWTPVQQQDFAERVQGM